MSNIKTRMTVEELLSIANFLGKPPILTAEDAEPFRVFFHSVVECVAPRNMIEMVYLRHFAHAEWKASFLVRHGAVAIQRMVQQNLGFRMQRAKLREERRRLQESREVDKLTQTSVDIGQLMQLERNFEEMVTDTQAIYEASDLDRHHNQALQQSIALHEQLSRLIASETKIRDEALRQLELFREGLGALAIGTVKSILDRESENSETPHLPEVADAPSIAPSAGDGSADPGAAEAGSSEGGV